ncbi:DUF4352 domain-containing protein [Turicibacter sp. TS3]|uniref:DUF4352 domain-containing protein n=1 Tax=Turicibacter sp. TS3 TaxID=2304578 RepID=UPI00137A32CF|nr:DUF4352 domain-containing protein [Turicibacter sp. TS3]
MKRWLCCSMMVALLFFTACSRSDEKEEQKEEPVVTSEEFQQIYTNTKDYKGRRVEFYGKVFTEPSRDKNGTYLQVFILDGGNDGNTLVSIDDPNLEVSIDDIVRVTGVIGDEVEGENLLGVTMTMPGVAATQVEKVDYATAFAPSMKTVELNQELNQNGYKMTLERVEFAKSETRAYLKIENESSTNIQFYPYNSMVQQGNKQYDYEENWEAQYEQISDDILPGVVSEGVVTFPAIDLNGGDVRFVFEGLSDDYNVEFETFIFECPLQP